MEDTLLSAVLEMELGTDLGWADSQWDPVPGKAGLRRVEPLYLSPAVPPGKP